MQAVWLASQREFVHRRGCVVQKSTGFLAAQEAIADKTPLYGADFSAAIFRATSLTEISACQEITTVSRFPKMR